MRGVTCGALGRRRAMPTRPPAPAPARTPRRYECQLWAAYAACRVGGLDAQDVTAGGVGRGIQADLIGRRCQLGEERAVHTYPEQLQWQFAVRLERQVHRTVDLGAGPQAP